ncbi:MAG: tol-pal system-associated acyl-CoA thioesterase [Phreatobacter sp.]
MSEPAGHDHLAGRIEGETHLLPVRVYYEDTDFSGVVYHASYLRFMERGRTDFLRLLGVAQGDLFERAKAEAGAGFFFVVRSMGIEFLKPARIDDVLTVQTRTQAVKGATLNLAQRVLRGDEVLVEASVRVAFLAGGRPVRIPDGLRQVMTPRGQTPHG